MTEELRDRMAKLRAIAPRLNKATDDATRALSEVDKFLEELGIGVTVQTGSFHDGPPHAMGFDADKPGEIVSSFYLAYGRLNGRYRIHVNECVDQRGPNENNMMDWNTLMTELYAWESCPREIKLRSVAKLPELLDLILARAEGLSEAAIESTEAVNGMLASLGDREPETSSTAENAPLRKAAAKRLKASEEKERVIVANVHASEEKERVVAVRHQVSEGFEGMWPQSS
jgi:hypothetical protein